MEKIWYVYKHVRMDKKIPFYIGIGKKSNFGRAYEFNKEKRNDLWWKIFSKSEITVEIIYENLTKEEASLHEQSLIKKYGRIDLNEGSLTNLTDGGDGIWNAKRSDETKKILSEQKKGSKNPQYGKKQSIELINLRMKNIIGSKRSEETKKKQSLSSINSGQAKKTLLINFYTKEIIGTFHSISEACRSVGLCPKNDGSKASMVANGKRNQVKGYTFKYV